MTTSGLSTLRKTQIAAETVAQREYTGDAIDTLLGTFTGFHFLQHGNMTVTPSAELFTPEEQAGVFATNHSVIHTSRGTELSWEGPADFAQIVDFLLMGLKGNVVPTTVGDGFVWEFTPNNSSTNFHQSFTVEHGDDKMVARVPYVLASEIGFSGGIAEVMNMSASMFGREMVLRVVEETDGSITGLAANTRFQEAASREQLFTQRAATTDSPFGVLPRANMITMSRSKVFLDDNWGELGTTQMSGVVRSWEFTLPSGLAMFKTAEGLYDYIQHTEATRAATVSLTLVSEDAPIVEWKRWLDSNLRTIRITIDGPDITENVLRHQLIIDMNVRWNENAEIFSDDEGRSMIVMSGTTFFDRKNNNAYGTAVSSTSANISVQATASNITTSATGTIPTTTSVTVSNAGKGYTTAPTVTFPAHVTATATATLSGGAVTGFTITNGGSGYIAAPTVTVAAPGSGTTATAGTVTLSGGQITAIALGAGGSGYGTDVPEVTITAPTGVRAVGTATVSGGEVTGITVSTAGSGYANSASVVVTVAAPNATINPLGKVDGNDFRIIVVTTRGQLKAPFNIRTTARGSTTATVEWDDPGTETYRNASGTDTALTISGYDVEYKTESATTWTDASHSGTTQSDSFTGLTSGTTYDVRIRSQATVGSDTILGTWSDTFNFTTT